MKKQNNILRLIKNIIYLTVVCAFLSACADDEIYSSTHVKEGVPVTINFGLSLTGMEKLTRGLPETEEKRINDLYVLVFDRSGKLKNSKFYKTEDIVDVLERKESGEFILETTSGESRIYAIANVETNELESILTKLNAVKSIDDLSGVIISINEANVQRIQGSLVMSGTFNKTLPGAGEEAGYCVIDEHGNIPQGKIQLSRLDSHITFKIKVGNKVTSFTPISWQVKYVPLKSNVIGQANVNSFKEAGDYGNSIVSTAFKTNEDDKSRTFDFYMLENIKNSKSYKEKDGKVTSINPSATSPEAKKVEYAKREEEVKNDDGTNTGEYKYSEKYATYVEIKAEMEIENENSIDGKRVANVQYRIHLGGGINKPTIFTSKRNTKYTYNLTINDVNDIIVEVEDGIEKRPGAEGDVVDSEAEVRTLDAHYNCFIMGFSYNNVVDASGTEGLKFVVKTPFGDVTEKSTPDTGSGAKQDYHWIHFQSHEEANEANKLQVYQKSKLVDLFGLTEDIKKRYEKEESKDRNKLYYYTVFVDEYYYTEAPKGQSWGNDPTTYWWHFANQANRYVMLVYAPKYSMDGNSSYAKARYMITQRSIQTYYSTEAKQALGMEHVNETGAAKWGTPKSQFNSYNGLWNTWNYLNGNASWSTHVDLETPDATMNTYATKEKAIALARCLSRNRDENGDGKITLNEVKWYVPASEQLMGMYLGAKSLPTPLYDANNISFVYQDRIKYHYTTSDQKRIWSEEGASVGLYPSNGSDIPENFRCVRNLGIDKTTELFLSENDYPAQAFEYLPTNTRVKVYDQLSNKDEEISADRIFKMARLTDQNIRGSRLNKGEIALHDNFEDGNKPYKAFQMAKDKYTDTKATPEKIYVYEGNSYFALSSWHTTIRSCWYDLDNDKPYGGIPYHKLTTDNDRSLCKNYSENGDHDKGLWRAPNQREMMLMFIVNKEFPNGTASRTKWRYTIPIGDNAGNLRFFSVNDDGNLYLSNKADNTKKINIRCVRDVEIVK